MLGSAAARVIMLVAVLGASGPAPVRAKNPTPALLQGGVIEGLVYDSTASQPLAGARVFLWNTSMFATTDDAGHFAWFTAGRKLTKALRPYARCSGMRAGLRAFPTSATAPCRHVGDGP